MLIDALNASRFDRDTLEDLHRGGLTAIHACLGYWENATETMDRIGAWRDLIRENSDLVTLATDGRSIRQARDSGRTAIILGTQNSSPIEDRLRFVELFALMGLRIMQLTYNNQNAVGAGCYEPVDPGLSRFGREVVEEMNRVGILVDLSHTGEKTSFDAIEASSKPVSVTHSNPGFLVEHPRNKSAALIKALAARGGVIGITTFPHISGPWLESIDKWCEMIARTVDVAGIDHVGIGSDISRNVTSGDLMWMRRGRWTRRNHRGADLAGRTGQNLVSWPDFADSAEKYAAFPDALTRVGFNKQDAAKILGGNWLRIFDQVFVAPEALMTIARNDPAEATA